MHTIPHSLSVSLAVRAAQLQPQIGTWAAARYLARRNVPLPLALAALAQAKPKSRELFHQIHF